MTVYSGACIKFFTFVVMGFIHHLNSSYKSAYMENNLQNGADVIQLSILLIDRL